MPIPTAELLPLPPPATLTVDEPAWSQTLPAPRVMMVVEGCYPVSWGGVSTWCDGLIKGLPEVPFHVVAIVAQPGLPSVFDTPPNLVGTRTIALWNLHEVSESWPDATIGGLRAARARTTDAAVLADFLPPLRRFVNALLTSDADLDQLAADIHGLHRFLVDHDLGVAMRHPAVWQMLLEEGRGSGPTERPELRLWELTTAFQWLTRWLFPIARPFPEIDVVHLAMAGVCSMAGVAAKLEHRAGLLLTEHGVYLRERYLAEAERRDSDFLKTLSLGFALRMTQVTYRLADQISPCCDYNQRWELQAGADPATLETIYYGLDIDEYSPEARPTTEGVAQRPTIVWVGRINPLKDVETLLRAAAIVAREHPDVLFRLYGAAQPEDADYHRRCLDLHEELGLAPNVEFAGYTSNPVAAYLEGDFVVLSSVSEGFPYSILEAMLCGRPVVASAVGGIPEQILDTGVVVEPRNPEALAAGMLQLLKDPAGLTALADAARERAATMFTSNRFVGIHRASYLSLSPRHSIWTRSPIPAAAAVPAPAAVPGVLERSDALTRLVDVVRERTPRPVDSLEVAAVVESTGVTDAMARSDFGATDTFSLAEAVFEQLRSEATPATALRAPGSAPAHSKDASVLDTARTPALALVPTVALLAAIYWVSTSGRWSPQQVLALVTGITTGMVCTTGLALALVRRGSALVSLHKLDAVRRFIAWGGAVALGTTAAVSLLLVLPRWGSLEFISDNASTFMSAALVLSVVWTLATCLSLVSASGWTGVALSAGVLVGLTIDWVLGPFAFHLGVATVVGLGTAIAVMLRGLHLGLRREIGGKPSTDRTLPSLGYLLLEGVPYAFYGTAAVVLFFAIHLVGGLSLGYESPEFLTLEFGLFLPLIPSLLALGTAERLMRSFWVRTRTLQQTITVSETERFRSEAHQIYQRNTQRFLVSLAALSLATAILVAGLSRFDPLVRLAPATDSQAVAILFVTSLFAYGIFSWAQFNATYSLALQQWTGPVRSAGAGLVVTLAAALVIMQTVGYAWLAIALALGSAVYGTGTRTWARHVLAESDHHYATTV